MKSSYWKILNFAFMTAMTVSSGCTNSTGVLKGKFLKLPLKDAVKTADPTNAYDTISTEVIDNIYESIIQYDYDSDILKLIPNLTVTMPEVSKDGLTVTLKFRKDIKFHDDQCFAGKKGRHVTVDDFIYSFKRHANPANESQAFWIWDAKVKGINDFQAKFGKGRPASEIMKDEVEGFKKIDDTTMQIKLTKPYPQLLYIMAMHFTAPVPHEAVEKYGKDFANHPVGTGPFKVQSWNATSRIILVKNEEYTGTYKGRKIPFIDGIEFSIVKEDQPRWLGFLNGDFDQIQIPKDNFAGAIKNTADVTDELAKKGIRVSIEPAFSFWYISFNMKDAIIGKNKYLRQAIASSINQQQWLDLFKNGRGAVQKDMNPPSIVDRCGKAYKWPYDVARAKELLKKAGYPDGNNLPVLKYDTRGTNLSERQLAEFMVKSLGAIGIRTEIVANTFPAYLEKMNKGNLQISKGGWSMDYPDAENNLQLLFGPNKAPGPNEANFENAGYDQLYLKAALMASSEVRRNILCQMEDIVQEEMPWAYGIFENEYRLVQKWIPNYKTRELITNKYKYIETTKSM